METVSESTYLDFLKVPEGRKGAKSVLEQQSSAQVNTDTFLAVVVPAVHIDH